MSRDILWFDRYPKQGPTANAAGEITNIDWREIDSPETTWPRPEHEACMSEAIRCIILWILPFPESNLGRFSWVTTGSQHQRWRPISSGPFCGDKDSPNPRFAGVDYFYHNNSFHNQYGMSREWQRDKLWPLQTCSRLKRRAYVHTRFLFVLCQPLMCSTHGAYDLHRMICDGFTHLRYIVCSVVIYKIALQMASDAICPNVSNLSLFGNRNAGQIHNLCTISAL